MSNALMIVDMQNDYFPGGNMTLSGITDAAENAKKLLDFYRAKSWIIYHIQHISAYKGAIFFVANTPGVEINQKLAPLDSETVITKNYPNSFRGTDLLQELKSNHIDRLTICGAMSHLCIDATTRAAFDFGFKCTVVPDACATQDLRFEGENIPARFVHGAFMSALYPVYAMLKQTREITSEE